MIDLAKYRVHDLTHTYDEDIDGFSSSSLNTFEQDGWNAKMLRLYSHAGTHMDAPFHFGVSDQTIDQFLPTDVMGVSHIIDVSIQQSKQLIRLSDVAEQLASFKDGDSLIIRTGWSTKYTESNFKRDLPRISEDLANWCVAHSVKLLGVEPLSVADVENLPEVTRIHQILLGGNIVIVEGLRNLDRIKSKIVFLIALPLKIKDGDGAPARVIALEER